MMKRDECFRVLNRHVHDDDMVVATFSSAFEWIGIRKHPLNYLPVGAMGLASSHALGLALGRPDKRVLVLDGDGSLLMNLGSLVTVAEAAPPNLWHFVCENGTYEANGAYPIPQRGKVSFAGFARAAGYRNCYEFSELAAFEAQIATVLAQAGPTFINLKVEPGPPLTLDYGYMHGAGARTAFRNALNSLSRGR